MAEAKHDGNQVPAMMGVLNTNGATPTRIEADPTLHSLDVEDNTTGSDAGNDWAARDNNGETVLCASDTNGTIIPLFVDSTGRLLIKST